MSIFGFGFQLHNVSTRTLYQLNNLDKRSLLWGIKSIDNYLQLLLKFQPEYIIGLGIYTGKEKNILHLETETRNVFKKSKIDIKETESLLINPFLSENENLRFSETIGSSFCNYVSWKIVNEIKLGNLKSQYSFVHIPKNFDYKEGSEYIQKSLDILL